MKARLLFLLLVAGWASIAQTPTNVSPFDGRFWGVVLEHPLMKDVKVKEDVIYLKDEKGSLGIDIYLPPGLKPNEKRPAVIFLNGIGETPGQPKVKSWGIYREWPRLMAAHGFIGISMESDGTRIQESFGGLFRFLNDKGSAYQIDAEKLGVYAASANVTQSAVYLLNDDAFKGVKAAVFYYGGTPRGQYRKDLPVLFVIAEGDVARNGYTSLWSEVMKNNAPWTIKMGTGLPHGFDAFQDTDEARKVVKETISFWQNYLEPALKPSWPHSVPREILATQYMHEDSKAADLTKVWLETHPDDFSALRTYSGALKNAGRFAEAEIPYKKCLAQQPNDTELLADLSLVLYALNRPTEAEAYFSRAIQPGPLNPYQYLNMARVLYDRKNYSASAKFYELALKTIPSGVNFYNLACVYALANEKEKALENLSKAIENGFTAKQHIESDADMESLRNDSRYKALIAKL